MDSETFRTHAHEFADWMADYMADVERYPVRAQVSPGEIAAKIPPAAPQGGEDMGQIFADFQSDILPGLTHWQHPNFFAYFQANSSPPSVLAEMLTATLAVQCMLWQTSPAATELESAMMAWLRQMIGLPEAFKGTIQDSASTATLCALLVAREKACDWRTNDEGLSAESERLVVYCSEEAHSSVDKGMMVAGLGRANLRKIPTRDDFSMDPAALEARIADDQAAGHRPIAVIASFGSTGVGAVDPIKEIGEICQRQGLWFHVDAAWAGSALILPEFRSLMAGVETADSFVFNPHKWLYTNFDCTAFYVRDAEALQRTLSVKPFYLQSREADHVVDYSNWTVPLGRRFRALKLWFVLRSYGIADLQNRLENHIAWAQDLARRVAAEPDFETLHVSPFSLFNFRYRPEGDHEEAELDRINQNLLARLNDSGALYLTQNQVRGGFAIRFVVGQTWTTEEHVQTAWETIKATARNAL